MAKSKAMAFTTGGETRAPGTEGAEFSRVAQEGVVSNYTNTLDTLTASLADITKVDSELTSLDAEITKLADNKYAAKAPQLEKLTAIRNAMARRRQILSDAGTGRSQFQFNTSLNKNNLFNNGNNSLLG